MKFSLSLLAQIPAESISNAPTFFTCLNKNQIREPSMVRV